MNGLMRCNKTVGTPLPPARKAGVDCPSCQREVPESRSSILTNAYRVLLTRARQGMVIYIPKGDENDKTRLPEFYDGTFNS